MAIVAAALVATGCGSTTIEDGDESAAPTVSLDGGLQPADSAATPLESEVIVDDTALPTTEPIVGSAADLLPEIGIEMSRLSAFVGTGDVQPVIDQINGLWNAVRDEVSTSRPDLINSMQAMIDQANNAVSGNRPADADKAFSTMNDLIDAFVGDS